MKAMILAAGYGKRLRPLTEETPKPLLKIQRKTLIDYHLEKLAAIGINDIVVNLSYLGDKIKAYLGDGNRFGANIQYSIEPKPLGTGGGIKRALTLLGKEPFLLINSDVYSDYPFQNLTKMANKLDNKLAHLILVANPIHNLRGDYHLQNGHVYPRTDKNSCLTYTGMAIYRPELYQQKSAEEFAIAAVLDKAVAQQQVSGEFFQGEWHDIGTPERYAAAKEAKL